MIEDESRKDPSPPEHAAGVVRFNDGLNPLLLDLTTTPTT